MRLTGFSLDGMSSLIGVGEVAGGEMAPPPAADESVALAEIAAPLPPQSAAPDVETRLVSQNGGV